MLNIFEIYFRSWKSLFILPELRACALWNFQKKLTSLTILTIYLSCLKLCSNLNRNVYLKISNKERVLNIFFKYFFHSIFPIKMMKKVHLFRIISFCTLENFAIKIQEITTLSSSFNKSFSLRKICSKEVNKFWTSCKIKQIILYVI